jgi:hypothetical protein
MSSGYFPYISGTFLDFQTRFHEYQLNLIDGTGIGSPFASYVSEALVYSTGLFVSGASFPEVVPTGIALGYIKKYNQEYQHKMYAFTQNPNYLTGVPF